MNKYHFRTESESIIEAENEEEAWKKFWEYVEGQPQQNACNWIEDNTTLMQIVDIIKEV